MASSLMGEMLNDMFVSGITTSSKPYVDKVEKEKKTINIFNAVRFYQQSFIIKLLYIGF
jgi:hypothetical protein